MKMYTVFTFFQTQCSIVVYICSTLHLQYNIEYDSISDLKKDQTCFLDQSLVLGRGSPFSRSVSRDLTDVPPAQWPLPPSLVERSVRPLCFAPLAAAHTNTAAGRPTRQHYQHNVLWSMPPVHCVVGNTVNTWGDRRHNRRADDRLVYSPYNGDVHSPGKRRHCFLCRRRRCASCCCCTHYA